MPVRIIFRGLMLFQIPETGPNANKLVAYLINDAAFEGASPGHPHDHDAEIQILTGAENGNALLPKVLKREATLNIVAPRGRKGVRARRSFSDHLPDLGTIFANATQAVRDAGRGAPNRGLVQNVVTVDGGIVRVKDVVGWDEGGFPLAGDPDGVLLGERATAPAPVRFAGSRVRGHIASEVVVEIDATGVKLECDHDNRFNIPATGSEKPYDPHLPARTVEILITNFERPGDKPTPWGLDFQWLFQAAGYNAADLSGDEFDAWVSAGTAYDERLFKRERTMFLAGDPGKETIGRPFPFIDGSSSLTPLNPLTPPTPLTNIRNILVCVMAKVSPADTTMNRETITSASGKSMTREWRLVPRDGIAARKSPMPKAMGKKTAGKKPSVTRTTVKKTAAKKGRKR